MDPQNYRDAYANMRADERVAAAQEAARHYHEVPPSGPLAGLRRRLARLFRRA